jgi:hypothetical protein
MSKDLKKVFETVAGQITETPISGIQKILEKI